MEGPGVAGVAEVPDAVQKENEVLLHVRIRESSLQFRAEAFNATNTAIFAAPGNTVGTPAFGVVSSTSNTPRQLQFALKLQF